MSKLRNMNVNQCLNLLNDFYSDARLEGDDILMQKSKMARLALDQLSKIFGGDDLKITGNPICESDARAC